MAAPLAKTSHRSALRAPPAPAGCRNRSHRRRLLAGTRETASACHTVGIGSKNASAHMRVTSSIAMTAAGQMTPTDR